jgi:hypothetical protein
MQRQIAASLMAVMLGAIAVLARPAGSADASEWWCWDDPVVVINGQVIHVLTGVESRAVHRVTMADVVITVPNGVDARMTASTAPRFPQRARLVRSGSVNADGSIPITASVTVNGHGRFAAAIKITQPSGGRAVSYGESNQPITTTYTLAPRTAPATMNRK